MIRLWSKDLKHLILTSENPNYRVSIDVGTARKMEGHTNIWMDRHREGQAD